MERKILKFYADWCGPCHRMTPVVQKVASAHNIEVEQIDIDSNRELAEKYAVGSIPTIILLEDGKEIARQTGSSPSVQLENSLGLS